MHAGRFCDRMNKIRQDAAGSANFCLTEVCDSMKTVLRGFCCGVGGYLVGVGFKALGTFSGALMLTLGVFLLAVTFISMNKDAKKKKEEQ